MFDDWKFIFGGITSESNAINAFTTDIKLDAASVCPRLLLTDPMSNGVVLWSLQKNSDDTLSSFSS